MTSKPLGRDEAVRRLVASEAKIRGFGVQRLALFGSVLRGEAGPDSDVDVLVQFSSGAKTFEHFLALSDLLEELLGKHVELVTTEARSRRSSGRESWLKPKMSFEPRDYLRHILVDWLMCSSSRASSAPRLIDRPSVPHGLGVSGTVSARRV